MNLFSGRISQEGTLFPPPGISGGGNIGSNANLHYRKDVIYFKALSTIVGIILPSKGEEASKQGLVFTSIKYTLKLESIMKSYPNIY